MVSQVFFWIYLCAMYNWSTIISFNTLSILLKFCVSGLKSRLPFLYFCVASSIHYLLTCLHFIVNVWLFTFWCRLSTYWFVQSNIEKDLVLDTTALLMACLSYLAPSFGLSSTWFAFFWCNQIVSLHLNKPPIYHV